MLYAVLCVSDNCFVVRECAVSRVYINGRRCVVVNVMLSLTSVMSLPSVLCDLWVRMVVKLCTLGVKG